ncbi:MAG: DUF3843 family protein [Bacteroidales bacterium]|nr:DUF3843 family protein [Bacteroidales bacterium]
MKLQKIVINEIKKCHPYQNPSSTDLYYQRLANRLQDGFSSLCKMVDEPSVEMMMHRGAIILTNYMEDIVADSGQWHTFSNLCQELYGHPVPLFHEDEEYYPDEPSLNAIRYLLWSVGNEILGDVVMTNAKLIELMATVAYDILYETFEEAPINEKLADDVESKLILASEDFDQLRSVLKWLFNDCYLTAGEHNEELIGKHVDDLLDLAERGKIPDMHPSMAYYYATTKCIFDYKIGPLALYPKDYLAAMMHTKGMDRQAEDVAKIDKLGMGIYKYERIKPAFGLSGEAPKTDRLRLTRTNGKVIEIEAYELNLSKEELERFDGFFASSFVYYQSEWHLNGFVTPFSDIDKHWKKMCEDDPENLKPGTATLTAEMILERTNGLRIAYFADREQLKDFLEKKIRFPRHMLNFVDERIGRRPTLFIDTEEPKNCLQIFYGFTPYIADPSNPFYNPKEAREEAITLLWEAESVTTHAVNYLLDNNFLPDIYNDRMFSNCSTLAEKRHDIDFLMRFYRMENY